MQTTHNALTAMLRSYNTRAHHSRSQLTDNMKALSRMTRATDKVYEHVACLFCQRALSEVDWELREEFHTQASAYVSAGLFGLDASLDVRMAQLKSIHEMEEVPLVPYEAVARIMSKNWRKAYSCCPLLCSPASSDTAPLRGAVSLDRGTK